MTIFVAVQAPELVSRDLRSRVLPLYFARPIKTIDYPLAKYLAFTAACLVMMEVPLLLLYGGSIANVHGGAAVWAQTRALIPGLLVGLMWAVVLAAISLFLASLTGRRAFATGAVAIFFLLTFTLAEILLAAEGQQPWGTQSAQRSRAAAGRASNRGAIGLPAADLRGEGLRLVQPVHPVRRGRMWLGGTDPADGVPDPGGFGAVYALVLVVITGLCLAGLARPLPEGAAVMTVIRLAERQPLVRQRGRGQRHHDGHRPRRHRPARPERRGQVHHPAHDRRLPGAVPGHADRGASRPTWHNPDIYRSLGLVPERDSVYAFLTGEQFVRSTAKLHELPDPGAATRRAIEMTDMAHAADRKIATYSKGMRQRIKVAAALVHDPEILLLDEPFNGMDPRQRIHMMELLAKLGAEGRTILFSSHILEEVERLSGTIQVMVAGRLAASGDFRAIRRLMTSRPHVFNVRSSDDRRLAALLVGRPYTTAVELTAKGLQVRTSDFGAFCAQIAELTRDHKIALRELLPTDESLESVFGYLISSQGN